MGGPRRIGEVSFWYHDIGGAPAQRSPLDGDCRADVCIVGAGYTGLWTAYYLKKADPSLNVVIVERNFAGFGASGRNGGWLTGGFAWNHGALPERSVRKRCPRDGWRDERHGGGSAAGHGSRGNRGRYPADRRVDGGDQSGAIDPDEGRDRASPPLGRGRSRL